MKTTLFASRLGLFTAILLLVGTVVPPIMRAQSDPTGEETGVQILLEDANRDRTAQGKPALTLNPALSAAAQQHAEMMAQQNILSHDLPGEAGLAQRAASAGAHFSSIAENIAVSDALHRIHESWMQSAPHNANLMNAEFTIVGIGIAKRGGKIFAVEDFATPVASASFSDVEQRINDMLSIRNIQTQSDSKVARQVCATPQGSEEMPQPNPKMVLRFASPDLTKLGPILDEKIGQQKFSSAAVGACPDTSTQGFTRYRVAILFY
jgi:Cysteine-rich secretory protein family